MNNIRRKIQRLNQTQFLIVCLVFLGISFTIGLGVGVVINLASSLFFGYLPFDPIIYLLSGIIFLGSGMTIIQRWIDDPHVFLNSKRRCLKAD